jgi:hypothetical protein
LKQFRNHSGVRLPSPTNKADRISETGPIEAKGLILQNIRYPRTKAEIIAQNAISRQRRYLKN